MGPERSRPPRVISRADTADHRCRCGVRLAAGATYLQLSGVSERLVGIFSEQRFCSMGCLRAFFLETLAELEVFDTAKAEVVVSDLRYAYADLAAAFASVLQPGSAGRLD